MNEPKVITRGKLTLRKVLEPELVDAEVVKVGLYAKCLVDDEIQWIKADEVPHGTHVMGHEMFEGYR